MAKAAFNITVDVRFGSGTATPGVIKFSTAARYINQTQITVESDAMGLVTAYVTYRGGLASAGDVLFFGPTITIDWTTADTVDIPAHGIFGYVVYWTDRVANGVSPFYRRLHIGPPP